MKNLTANTYRNLSVLALMMLRLLLWIPVQVEAGTIQRISVNNNGEETNGHSDEPFISDNGRFVVFESEASNLVEGDTNKVRDIFVYDRLESQIERVSVDSNGNEGNRLSYRPSISADGHYVVFLSYADNLTVGDTNEDSDLFVHNRENRTTQRLSGNKKNYRQGIVVHTPMISDNGKYVVFDTNYFPIDKESYQEQRGLFLHDLESGSTSFVECYGCRDVSKY